MDEEKSKHAALNRENDFEQAYLHSLLRLEKGNQHCAPARKDCDNLLNNLLRLKKGNQRCAPARKECDNLLRLGKGNQRCAPARKECNKYDLTASPCFLIGQR